MPTTKDGERMGRILAEAGLKCSVCKDVADLGSEINRGAAALAMLTEEAVVADRNGDLLDVLRSLPPWSDFPLVVPGTGGGKPGTSDSRVDERDAGLSRPVKVRSLLSVVRAAAPVSAASV